MSTTLTDTSFDIEADRTSLNRYIFVIKCYYVDFPDVYQVTDENYITIVPKIGLKTGDDYVNPLCKEDEDTTSVDSNNVGCSGYS